MTEDEEDREYEVDMATKRRVELQLSNNCLMCLQYFPEFNNISLSFYTKNMPGFTLGMPTEDWPAVQELVKNFNYRGRKQ